MWKLVGNLSRSNLLVLADQLALSKPQNPQQQLQQQRICLSLSIAPLKIIYPLL
jgi:hypothetical protein